MSSSRSRSNSGAGRSLSKGGSQGGQQQHHHPTPNNSTTNFPLAMAGVVKKLTIGKPELLAWAADVTHVKPCTRYDDLRDGLVFLLLAEKLFPNFIQSGNSLYAQRTGVRNAKLNWELLTSVMHASGLPMNICDRRAISAGHQRPCYNMLVMFYFLTKLGSQSEFTMDFSHPIDDELATFLQSTKSLEVIGKQKSSDSVPSSSNRPSASIIARMGSMKGGGAAGDSTTSASGTGTTAPSSKKGAGGGDEASHNQYGYLTPSTSFTDLGGAGGGAVSYDSYLTSASPLNLFAQYGSGGDGYITHSYSGGLGVGGAGLDGPFYPSSPPLQYNDHASPSRSQHQKTGKVGGVGSPSSGGAGTHTAAPSPLHLNKSPRGGGTSNHNTTHQHAVGGDDYHHSGGGLDHGGGYTTFSTAPGTSVVSSWTAPQLSTLGEVVVTRLKAEVLDGVRARKALERELGFYKQQAELTLDNERISNHATIEALKVRMNSQILQHKLELQQGYEMASIRQQDTIAKILDDIELETAHMAFTVGGDFSSGGASHVEAMQSELLELRKARVALNGRVKIQAQQLDQWQQGYKSMERHLGTQRQSLERYQSLYTNACQALRSKIGTLNSTLLQSIGNNDPQESGVGDVQNGDEEGSMYSSPSKRKGGITSPKGGSTKTGETPEFDHVLSSVPSSEQYPVLARINELQLQVGSEAASRRRLELELLGAHRDIRDLRSQLSSVESHARTRHGAGLMTDGGIGGSGTVSPPSGGVGSAYKTSPNSPTARHSPPIEDTSNYHISNNIPPHHFNHLRPSSLASKGPFSSLSDEDPVAMLAGGKEIMLVRLHRECQRLQRINHFLSQQISRSGGLGALTADSLNSGGAPQVRFDAKVVGTGGGSGDGSSSSPNTSPRGGGTSKYTPTLDPSQSSSPKLSHETEFLKDIKSFASDPDVVVLASNLLSPSATLGSDSVDGICAGALEAVEHFTRIVYESVEFTRKKNLTAHKNRHPANNEDADSTSFAHSRFGRNKSNNSRGDKNTIHSDENHDEEDTADNIGFGSGNNNTQRRNENYDSDDDDDQGSRTPFSELRENILRFGPILEGRFWSLVAASKVLRHRVEMAGSTITALHQNNMAVHRQLIVNDHESTTKVNRIMRETKRVVDDLSSQHAVEVDQLSLRIRLLQDEVSNMRSSVESHTQHIQNLGHYIAEDCRKMLQEPCERMESLRAVLGGLRERDALWEALSEALRVALQNSLREPLGNNNNTNTGGRNSNSGQRGGGGDASYTATLSVAEEQHINILASKLEATSAAINESTVLAKITAPSDVLPFIKDAISALHTRWDQAIRQVTSTFTLGSSVSEKYSAQSVEMRSVESEVARLRESVKQLAKQADELRSERDNASQSEQMLESRLEAALSVYRIAISELDTFSGKVTKVLMELPTVHSSASITEHFPRFPTERLHANGSGGDNNLPPDYAEEEKDFESRGRSKNNHTINKSASFNGGPAVPPHDDEENDYPEDEIPQGSSRTATAPPSATNNFSFTSGTTHPGGSITDNTNNNPHHVVHQLREFSTSLTTPDASSNPLFTPPGGASAVPSHLPDSSSILPSTGVRNRSRTVGSSLSSAAPPPLSSPHLHNVSAISGRSAVVENSSFSINSNMVTSPSSLSQAPRNRSRTEGNLGTSHHTGSFGATGSRFGAATDTADNHHQTTSQAANTFPSFPMAEGLDSRSSSPADMASISRGAGGNNNGDRGDLSSTAASQRLHSSSLTSNTTTKQQHRRSGNGGSESAIAPSPKLAYEHSVTSSIDRPGSAASSRSTRPPAASMASTTPSSTGAHLSPEELERRKAEILSKYGFGAKK